MNIFELLVKDHRDLRSQISALRQAKGKDRVEIGKRFEQLKTDLLVHHEAEQHVLFMHLARLESLGGEALHAVEEHGEHKKLLEMMDDMPSYGDEWWAAFDELAHDVIHHLDEEEEDIFPLAEENLHTDTIESLARSYGASKGGNRTAIANAA
jgi:hemerythrin superfamily protein